MPDLILVEITDKNLPISYANAFLKPAQAWEQETLMQNAISKLDRYGRKLRTAYDLNGSRAYLTTEDPKSDDKPVLDDAEQIRSLAKLQAWVEQKITEVIRDR